MAMKAESEKINPFETTIPVFQYSKGGEFVKTQKSEKMSC
jgi:hypothetical protein